MAAPEGCALAEEPPGRPTRARLLAGAALPSLREAHTLGTVPLLFRQRRALACGAESRGDWASLGPGGARPAPRDWQAGLSRLLFVSDAPLQWHVREYPVVGPRGRLCVPEPLWYAWELLTHSQASRRSVVWPSWANLPGVWLLALQPAGPARREASRAVSCWALLSVPALIGGAGAPVPLPVHLPVTRCLGHPRPTMVVALPLWPLSSPGVLLRPRNHHTKSAGCLGVCLVAFVSASPVLSLDRPRVRSWPSLRPLGQAVQSRGWAASGNVLRFWCPRGLGRATLAVTQHLQVGLAWLARPWRLFLQMPVPAVGAGGL